MSLAKILVPGSKSITQRAIVLAALSCRPTQIENALACDDSRVLCNILQRFGVKITWDSHKVIVEPPKFLNLSEGNVFDCENAGTAFRFSACLSLIVPTVFTLDGNNRMRERPMGGLVKALKTLGVNVEFGEKDGFPPLQLGGPKQLLSNKVLVDASVSSQFASGILLVAPLFKDGLSLSLSKKFVSSPYINLTLHMLSEFQCKALRTSDTEFFVEYGKPQRDTPFTVETDWSSAAFILAAAHIAKKKVSIPNLNLNLNSPQGDRMFVQFLESMKSNEDRQIDLTHTPDLIAPLAALAVFAKGNTHLFGAAHTREKECDRISVLTHALKRVGCKVLEQTDGMIISPPSCSYTEQDSVTLNAQNDHRMAMAFGLLSIGGIRLNIEGSECVSKSFPDFWNRLDEIKKA